jgi:hypothetical protein
VFRLGAGAFVLAVVIVLILGEETKGKMLESISHSSTTRRHKKCATLHT